MATAGSIHIIAAGTALIYQLSIFRLGGFDIEPAVAIRLSWWSSGMTLV